MAFFRRQDSVGYVMVIPFYSIFFVFTFIPILIGFSFSFTNYDLYKTFDFVGLDNYIRLFKDEHFITSLYNTLLYALLTIVPGIVFGLITAVFLNNKIVGMKFFRVSFYMPYVVSMVAASMIWLWIYDPTFGILNIMLEAVGFTKEEWLHNPQLAMYCIAFMSLWKVVGYNMIIYLAGIQSIPSSLYEAATVDGASSIRKFFHITIPLLKPTSFFLLVTSCIHSFNVFEQVNIMTGGGPLQSTTTIVHQIYTRAFTEFQMGYSSAMAMVLFLIVAIVTLANFKFGSKGTDTEMS